MPAYLLIQIRFLADRSAFAPLSRRGRAACGEVWWPRTSSRAVPGVEPLEGTHDGRSLVILEFPSMGALESFWSSPNCAELRTLRPGAGPPGCLGGSRVYAIDVLRSGIFRRASARSSAVKQPAQTPHSSPNSIGAKERWSSLPYPSAEGPPSRAIASYCKILTV